MSTYEILTIILTVFSGVVAVSAIIVPIILNYLTRRAEFKKNSPEVQDKLMFKEYRLNYLNLVNELILNLSMFLNKSDDDNKVALISTIYKLYFISDNSLKSRLKDILKLVQNEKLDKHKLQSQLIFYLEEIDEQNFNNYWYGLHFYDKPHSFLSCNSNKKHRNKNK